MSWNNRVKIEFGLDFPIAKNQNKQFSNILGEKRSSFIFNSIQKPYRFFLLVLKVKLLRQENLNLSFLQGRLISNKAMIFKKIWVYLESFLTQMTSNKTKDSSTASFNFHVDWKRSCHDTEQYTWKVQDSNPLTRISPKLDRLKKSALKIKWRIVKINHFLF